MRDLPRRFHKALILFGFDPSRTIRTLRMLPAFLRDRRTLQAQQGQQADLFPFGKLYPCLDDRTGEGGVARGHYFHQDLLVARRIFQANPRRHVDVGSRIDGFVAHVASFRPIEVFDIRDLQSRIPNVTFRQADMMAPLEPALHNYCDSLSCLHALEHFGLGRYGDPIRADGHRLGLQNLVTLLEPGGTLYLSVPIGPQRIEFNAHRVFSLRHLLELFQPRLSVKEFSYVDDQGDLHEDQDLTEDSISRNFGCYYGCGIFRLRKD